MTSLRVVTLFWILNGYQRPRALANYCNSRRLARRAGRYLPKEPPAYAPLIDGGYLIEVRCGGGNRAVCV